VTIETGRLPLRPPSHADAGFIPEDGGVRRALERVLAITSLDNLPSIRLLGKLGFADEGTIRPSEEKLRLFVRQSRAAETLTAPGGGAGCDPS